MILARRKAVQSSTSREASSPENTTARLTSPTPLAKAIARGGGSPQPQHQPQDRALPPPLWCRATALLHREPTATAKLPWLLKTAQSVEHVMPLLLWKKASFQVWRLPKLHGQWMHPVLQTRLAAGELGVGGAGRRKWDAETVNRKCLVSNMFLQR